MIPIIFSVLSAAITIYTLMCFICVILSWFPGARFTRFGHFIERACLPYMNFFSRFGWLRLGNIDFSPIISIGVLSVASSILSRISATGTLYFGAILESIIYMLWNVCSSILSLLFIVVLIRWIVLLVKNGQTSMSSVWYQVDRMIESIVFKISSTFFKTRVSYQKALLVTWITLMVFLGVGRFLVGILCALCMKIPF